MTIESATTGSPGEPILEAEATSYAPGRTDPASEGPVGNDPAFRAVFDEHARFVWRLLRRVGVLEAHVEDACQEVFLVVHRRLPDFDGLTASLRTWIFRIAIRVASDYRRRERRRSRHETPMDPVPEFALGPAQEGTVEVRDRLRILDGLLAGLEETKREVFILHDIEQLPMSEIAPALGCPLQTAYSRLYAARRDMDAALDRARARKELP